MYPFSLSGLVQKTLTILLLGAFAVAGFAQQTDVQIAQLRRPLSAVQQVVMPTQDNQSLLEEELNRRGPGIAPRFAVTMAVDITPESFGDWEQLPNGNSVWRLRLRSAGAHSLNLGFTQYLMPDRGTMILYSPDGKRVMGPFTPSDNETHEQLWTPVFEGDELVIEVQLPSEKRHELQLHLTSVNHDFVGFSALVSGSCNLDVICGAADGWAIVDHYRDIIQSVAVIGLNGNTFCTGFLINNARNDCTPYFMTANHCGINNGNAATFVAYWNYQNSFCRQPNSPQSGGGGNGQLNNFNTGAIFRATYSPSDFTLIELDDDIPASANAFFAGWVVADETPQDSVICIHHPSTDEKRITFEFDPTYRGNWGSGDTPVPNGNHVIVPDWNIGTTEGGSSGSPLFDRHKRVVGQLHGGSAFCGNDLYDSFGWFTTSWLGGGASNNQLKAWLDPDNTGITSLDGRYQLSCSYFVLADAPSQSVCAPDTVVYTLQISDNFTDTVDLSVIDLPAGLTATLSVDSIPPGGSVTLTITGTENLAEGDYLFTVSGTDATNQAESTLSLQIYNGITQPALSAPADGAIGLGLSPVFTWSGAAGGTTYDIQVASDPDFTQIVSEFSGLTAPTASGIQLGTESTYYWRVRANNLCGASDWTTPFSLTTAAISCAQVTNTTPVAISPVGTPTVLSITDISAIGQIVDVRINGLNIQHTWVGDVIVQLASPIGTIITLVDRPGVPGDVFGCDGDNILLNLYDGAPNSANDLEEACSNLPALAGDYEPVNPFAVFANEQATGTWTLIVTDAVNSDGGSLISWQLEVCTTLPSDISLNLLEPAPAICAGDSTSMELLAGNGFTNDTISIFANGLPGGASISYSPNPATTGEAINVTFNGFTDAGSYPIQLWATDGIDTAYTDVEITVTGAPGQAALLSPSNGATDVPSGLVLQWEPVDGALYYQIILSLTPNFEDTSALYTRAVTNLPITGLLPNLTYYWRVDVFNDCGETIGTTIYSFTIEADYAFSLSPTSLEECNSAGNTAIYVLTTGNGFTGPASLTYTVTPPNGPTPSFSQAPDNINPGDVVTIVFENLNNSGPGNYLYTFSLGNGNNASAGDVLLALNASPGLATLNSPPDNAQIAAATPQLQWGAAVRADNYTVEVSRNDMFTDIVQTATTGGVAFTIDALPEPGVYYWRISANNECGSSLTSAFDFNFQPNSVETLQGQRLYVEPNPTGGLVQVRFAAPLDGELQVEVFTANGQRLQKQTWLTAPGQFTIDLGDYAPGTYLVRLTSQEDSVTQRIIKQ
jgi:subtilisin-like proprotein convertase family protein